eukprot:2686089-Rhodomonas_salina.1
MFQYDHTDSKSVARAANCAHELLYSSTGQTIWYGHVTEGVWSRFCELEVSANTLVGIPTALSAIKTNLKLERYHFLSCLREASRDVKHVIM